MKKIIFIALTLIFSITLGYSQDIITKTTSEKIQAKVIEVTASEIKYKKFDNPNGPNYSMGKSEIAKIRYENGTEDVFDNGAVMLDENILKISRENPIELTKRGNKVFIEIPDEPSRAGEKYFLEALTEWGYWNIVTDVNQAHFILIFNIDKKAFLDKSACVTFKTREGKEFKKSDYYRSSTNAFHGYNAFKAVAQKIVEKYLMKEFK